MTLWDAYLLLLHRLGLGPKPAFDSSESDSLTLFTFSNAGPSEFSLVVWGSWLGAFFLALLGELLVLNFPGAPWVGALLMLTGAGWFVWAVWASKLEVGLSSSSQQDPLFTFQFSFSLTSRLPILAVALVLSLLTFLMTGKNNIPDLAFITLALSVVAWMWLFWETDIDWLDSWRKRELDFRPLLNWLVTQRLKLQTLWIQGVAVNFSPTTILLCVILLVAAYFRFYKLAEVPIEMTSDHVEKLIDANDILNGARPIFEPANGGREPLAFYFVALAANFNGLNHLTLKIVMAVAGFLTLPFIFLIARELFEDDTLALLTVLLAGLSWWANTISRNGLRFPFAPLFGSIALWLLLKAIKQRRLNLSLWAGLFFGIGLYGYTPVRVMIIVFALVLVLYAAHHASRFTWLNVLKIFGALSLVALAVYVPTVRYAVDEPENYWRRSFTRMFGDPAPDVAPPPPWWPTLVRNEWQSLTMFFSSADNAWLVSPAGQPALDWVLSACFLLGVAFLIYRYARYRDWRDLFVLLAIPLLLSPSTLALALPDENPSLHRSGMALLVVFMVCALPLRLLLAMAQRLFTDWRGKALGLSLVGALLLISAQLNWQIMFVTYAKQYKDSVQNASELGEVVQAWQKIMGTTETVVVKAYPYWVDTRAVGIYANQFNWNNVILDGQPLLPTAWRDDLRSKLYILNRHDVKSVAELRALFPQGVLTYQQSDFFDKDYLTFYVPGTKDFDETTLTPKK